MTELRNEATIAEVRIAVTAVAEAATEPVRLNAQFLGKVAGELHLRTDQGDRFARQHWNKFAGQVQRTLAEMAAHELLYKGTGAHGALYRTPEQHREHLAAESAAVAARQARHAERVRVYDELALHGLTPESERGHEIRLNFISWSHILTVLDAAVAGRAAG